MSDGGEDKAVEAANADFYDALEQSSIELMADVWLHEEWVKCIHPGWDLIVGWRRVKESWERIFENERSMKVSPSEVWVRLSGDLAWVTCTEHITVINESSFESVQAVATNLFVKRDGRWLMSHHHASPIPMVVPDVSTQTIQ
jgi:ketosteroid isomerase-like protein